MPSCNLNDKRAAIETELSAEFSNDADLVFGNIYFDTAKFDGSWIHCVVSFGASSYTSQQFIPVEATGDFEGMNTCVGLATFDIYTKIGGGTGDALAFGRRIKNRYNRKTIDGIDFDPPIGPESQSSEFKSFIKYQVRVPFNIYEFV